MTIITNKDGTTYDNSLPFKMVNSDGINLTVQEIADQQAQQAIYTAQAPINSINQQIAALEATQTSDIIRNSILGDAPSIATLTSIQTQVSALQKQIPALQATLTSTIAA